MKINKEVLTGGLLGSGVSATGSAMSLDQIDRILSISCSVVGIIITIVVAVIIPLIRWWKKAKEDGKITKDELQEGVDIIKNGIEDVKNSSNKEKED